MEKNQLTTAAFIVFVASAIAGCGGSTDSGSEGEASISPSSLAVERRLVADFTDASILLQPSYLAASKDVSKGDEGGDADSQAAQDNEQIDFVFLQKWTVEDAAEPALYVKKAFVDAADGSAELATEGAIGAIVIDGLVPALDEVQPTSTGQTYFSLDAPLEYNGGQSCALFAVVDEADIICADGDLSAADIKGTDRSGNIYYFAHKGGDVILRRRSASDGNVLDLATVSEPWNAINVYPDGSIIVQKYQGKGPFKKITEAGVVELGLPSEYESINDFTITGDGRFLFTSSKKKDGDDYTHGIFVVPFEGGEPLMLADLDQAQMSGAGFYWDQNNNIWGSSSVSSVGGVLFPIDTSTPFVPVTTKEPGWIVLADAAGNEIYSISYENDTSYVYRFIFGTGTVEAQKAAELSGLYVDDVVKGLDGRILFTIVHPGEGYADHHYRLGIQNQDGQLSITMPFGGGRGNIYPLK